MAGQVSGCRAGVREGFALACVPGAPVAFGHATGLLPDVGSHAPNAASQSILDLPALASYMVSKSWWRFSSAAPQVHILWEGQLEEQVAYLGLTTSARCGILLSEAL